MGFFDLEKKQIRRLVKIAAADLAERTFAQLVNLSPVWSGSYVRSHRIGIGGESKRPPTELPPPLSSMGIASPFASIGIEMQRKAEAMDEEAHRVDKAEAFDKIVISNDIEHALDVEKFGTLYAPTGWHCYKHAENYIREHSRQIIKQAEKRAAKEALL